MFYFVLSVVYVLKMCFLNKEVWDELNLLYVDFLCKYYCLSWVWLLKELGKDVLKWME